MFPTGLRRISLSSAELVPAEYPDKNSNYIHRKIESARVRFPRKIGTRSHSHGCFWRIADLVQIPYYKIGKSSKPTLSLMSCGTSFEC